MRAGRTATRRAACAAAILLILSTLPACAPLAYFLHTAFPEKVKPTFVPEDRMTVVLIDDPSLHLGSGVLAGAVAQRIEADLAREEVIARFVPAAELQDLRTKLDRAYPSTPIDQVGKMLGAEQVIYVRIERVQISSDPGLLVPEALVSVKVIDAAAGKRLYPPYSAAGNPGGQMVHSKLAQRVQMEAHTPGVESILLQKLSVRIGRDVARLFYTYEADPPAKMADDD